MQTYLETFFRHNRALVAVVGIALIISIGFVVVQPRTYEAAGRMWFQSTSIAGDATQANTYLTPADVATSVFLELLNTRSFCVAVANRGPLTKYLKQPGHMPAPDPLTAASGLVERVHGGAVDNGGQQAFDDALQGVLQKRVKVVATGPQIVTVLFDYTDAKVAAGTVTAMLDQFSEEVLTAQRVQNQHQLTFYDQQVTNQQKQVNDADAAVARYLAQHPELRVPQPPPDATFNGLQEVANQAHQHYGELLQQQDQARVQQSNLSEGNSSQFRVIDPPLLPQRPTSLLKTVLFATGGGLGIGLLVALVALVVLVYTSRTFSTAGDVERSLNLKVIGTIPLQPLQAATDKDPQLESSRPSPDPGAVA
jgi:uncharacterized protein involved in exopolysaccharide biosynthesis